MVVEGGCTAKTFLGFLFERALKLQSRESHEVAIGGQQRRAMLDGEESRVLLGGPVAGAPTAG
jgi:hypothetical protein